jgi:hypothetical protein
MAVVKALEWQSVESSLFTAAAYRRDARQLYLRFRDGNIYRYFDVPLRAYKGFLAAESKGRHFASHIRNEFRYEQVRDARRRTSHSLGKDDRKKVSAGLLTTQPA